MSRIIIINLIIYVLITFLYPIYANITTTNLESENQSISNPTLSVRNLPESRCIHKDNCYHSQHNPPQINASKAHHFISFTSINSMTNIYHSNTSLTTSVNSQKRFLDAMESCHNANFQESESIIINLRSIYKFQFSCTYHVCMNIVTLNHRMMKFTSNTT